MVAAVAASAAIACRPAPGLGSVTLRRGRIEHVVDLATCRERTRPAPQAVERTLVAPDGKWAATVRTSGMSSNATQTVVVTSRRSGAEHVVMTLPAWSVNGTNGSPGPIMLLGWSGDDRWLFFAIDPMNSQSIIADGVYLRAVAASGGASRPVAMALGNADYRAWCGGRLVLTAGGDRIATRNKSLVSAAPPFWTPKRLVAGAGRAWGSLVCAPDGVSVVVQSQPQAKTENESFIATRWALWQVGLDGSQRRLTSPPAGYADESPRFSRDGRTLMFVRSRRGAGKLYALRGGRLVGPLLSLGSNLGYYGHHDWWGSADWSLGTPR